MSPLKGVHKSAYNLIACYKPFIKCPYTAKKCQMGDFKGKFYQCAGGSSRAKTVCPMQTASVAAIKRHHASYTALEEEIF